MTAELRGPWTSSSSNRRPKPRPSTSIWATATRVLPSYGHVRDLPEKDGSVLPDEDFRIIYEALDDRKKRVDEIARAVKDGAKRLILATDPDREGEAISWHLLRAAEGAKALKGVDVERVVFHEVTKPAVLEAMRHGRSLDEHLIDAYQARRALDYLVGFRLSPVLWRKLPKSGSLGRPRAVGGAAPDLRARGRDRGVQGAGILDRRGAAARRPRAEPSRRG